MGTNPNTAALSQAGVSLWLDDLSRDRIRGGGLQALVDEQNIVGVTTNPSIFQAAISGSASYDADIADLAAAGTDVEGVVTRVTTDDVRDAADLLRPVYDATNHVDGRVSIEVDPRLAHETQRTIDQAQQLWDIVDRPNVLVKIPAAIAGLAAITEAISRGISVNVTLIFSVERYEQVVEAYLTGLEQAAEKGIDLSTIESVASFFVSRVDSEIDRRLDAIGTDEARALKGRAGIANAQLAYQAYERHIESPRFRDLAAKGANSQRVLWASTGVKNPEYPDTLYVDGLIARDVVMTVPEETLEAIVDHGDATGAKIPETYDDAAAVMKQLPAVGVDLDRVWAVLEVEGVEKFEASWAKLLDAVQEQMERF